MVDDITSNDEEIEEKPTEEAPEESDTTDWKAEAEKAKEIAENQRIRAEKAEAKAKQTKPSERTALSQTDLYALIKADVAEEDITDIQEYASLKKISIAEALKSSVVTKILEEKKESRLTELATSTGSNRRSTGRVSDDILVQNAQAGKLPDSDEDIRRLIEARKTVKR